MHEHTHTQEYLFCVYSMSCEQGIYRCFGKALPPLPSLISYFHASSNLLAAQPPPTASTHHDLSHIFFSTSLLRFNSSFSYTVPELCVCMLYVCVL